MTEHRNRNLMSGPRSCASPVNLAIVAVAVVDIQIEAESPLGLLRQVPLQASFPCGGADCVQPLAQSAGVEVLREDPPAEQRFERSALVEFADVQQSRRPRLLLSRPASARTRRPRSCFDSRTCRSSGRIVRGPTNVVYPRLSNIGIRKSSISNRFRSIHPYSQSIPGFGICQS